MRRPRLRASLVATSGQLQLKAPNETRWRQTQQHNDPGARDLPTTTTLNVGAAEKHTETTSPSRLPRSDIRRAFRSLFSVDTNITTPDQLKQVQQYFEAFKEGVGAYPLGVYSQYSVADAVKTVAPFQWGVNATGWSPKGWTATDVVQMPPHGGPYEKIINEFGLGNVDVDVTQSPVSVWTGHSRRETIRRPTKYRMKIAQRWKAALICS